MKARVTRVVQLGGNAALDLLFPRRCGLCGRFGALLCAACADALPPAVAPHCDGCGDRPRTGRLCGRCVAWPERALDSLTVAFAFEAGARRLIHRLKYERLYALAGPMGDLLAEYVPYGMFLPRAATIVPVPLHARRRRERGFNQSELLARRVGERWGIAVDAAMLARVRATRPQVQVAGAAARMTNVADAFVARPAVGHTLLLIDDVTTTGATLRACAAALRMAGAAAVHGLVFAHGE